MTHNILIASYLEPEHVERIRAVDPRLNVVYEPDLLRAPRYAADHVGSPDDERTPDQENRWRGLLAEADILFDFDRPNGRDLPALAPRLRWIQTTSAGIGKYVDEMEYATRMPRVVFTTASGVHAKPLAEFCLMVMLMFHKGLLRILTDQDRRHWERYAGTDLDGRTVVIVGVGNIGREVARVCKAMGMTVIGVDRYRKPDDLVLLSLDEYRESSELKTALRKAEHLVLIVPHTPDTEHMIGAAELALLPHGAIVINIGRGALIDEPALVDALHSGQVGAAGLDVFETEPLPKQSPLWGMPNVLVSPHSGSTSDRENGRIVDLFCENLIRYLRDEPMLNVLDTTRLY